MKILFVGDIVGRAGRNKIFELLPQVVNEHQIEFVIVNAENSAHGRGITSKIFNQLLEVGVDAVTLGNHAYAKEDVFNILDDEHLIRPINLDTTSKGRGYRLFERSGKRIMVANILGEVSMKNTACSPFIAAEQLVDVEADIKIIDLHGEATAEKIAFLHHYKNDFTAVLGTHTHVQTADEDIYQGCAYISDVGMTGPYQSVIGRDTDEVLRRFLDHEQTYYKVSTNEATFNAVVITIDQHSNRAIAIERIQIRP